MFARFMRFFPAYTLEAVLAMRAKRFFALNKQIRFLMAEEEQSALSIHHNSKPEDRMAELIAILAPKKAKAESGASRIGLVAKGEATVERVPGEIEAERERQRLASEEMKKDREAWLQKLKEKREREEAEKLS